MDIKIELGSTPRCQAVSTLEFRLLNEPITVHIFNNNIIPQVRMGYESVAMRLKAQWAFDSGYEGERNNCFSKIQLVSQKNIETKHLSQVKAGHQSFLAAKTLQISLLVGYNI